MGSCSPPHSPRSPVDSPPHCRRRVKFSYCTKHPTYRTLRVLMLHLLAYHPCRQRSDLQSVHATTKSDRHMDKLVTKFTELYCNVSDVGVLYCTQRPYFCTKVRKFTVHCTVHGQRKCLDSVRMTLELSRSTLDSRATALQYSTVQYLYTVLYSTLKLGRMDCPSPSHASLAPNSSPIVVHCTCTQSTSVLSWCSLRMWIALYSGVLCSAVGSSVEHTDSLSLEWIETQATEGARSRECTV